GQRVDRDLEVLVLADRDGAAGPVDLVDRGGEGAVVGLERGGQRGGLHADLPALDVARQHLRDRVVGRDLQLNRRGRRVRLLVGDLEGQLGRRAIRQRGRRDGDVGRGGQRDHRHQCGGGGGDRHDTTGRACTHESTPFRG